MKFITRYILLMFLTAGSFSVSIFANAIYPPVKYLGIEQGLSNNAVTCILQDHYGFMWMGTYNGLNKFDGSNFTIYSNSYADSNSLVSNHINQLKEDNFHHMWIGTQMGVSYFSYDDAKFRTVFYQSEKTGKKIKINSNINGLACSKTGETYIATPDLGLLIYSPGKASARKIKVGFLKGTYNVQALLLDAKEQLWLAIKDVGLCVYSPLNNQIKVVNPLLKTAACLKDDGRGNIWIGTENGLFKFNVSSRKLSSLSVPVYQLTSSNIKNLLFSKDQKLWIATDGGGVNILDLQTQQLSYILPREADGFLKSGAISDIYEDGESRKWIATLRGGVNIIDNQLQQFQLIKHDPLNQNSLVNNFVLSFCEDEQHNLWIGTDGGGLSFWDSKLKHYTNFTADKNGHHTLSSNFVVSMLKDYKNQIWVATFSGGIDLYQKNTGTFKHYTCYNTAKKTEENNLWKLFEDASHRLWAGTTYDGALYLYDPKTDQFELFDKNLTNIHSLFQDRFGTLWAGDYTSLIKIDILHKKHEFIPVNNAIRAMLEDRHGNFWIGTEGGGLLLFDRTSRKFKRYTDADGLPGNSVLNLLEDNRGKIWLSTYNGISTFDPQYRHFKNYMAADGLQSNQFSYNAALKLKSGELLFGGIKGFNRFNPEDINSHHQNAQLRITGMKINNVPLDQHPGYLESGTLGAIKKIIVPYNQATLAIDYVALEYSFPEKISYAYFLEGWDRSWNEVGKAKTAYYTRLNPGNYTLKIRATNTEGNWLPPQIISITVLSPWYFTWWAIAFYVVVTITIFSLIRINRIRQIRLQYEVEIANSNMEKEKELNEKKLSFFTNISHEFRTPLTLIINPIKDLLTEANQSGKSELNVIYRNARRLLGLVDQLLLFRRTETENDKLNIVSNDFLSLCNDVFTCFIQQAKTKNIAYNFACEQEHVEIYGDREKIEISLFNLVSNAFNFTPDGGKIDVAVREDSQSVFFQITDNGRGVAEDMDGKIFDKFYQGKNNGTLKNGFGIGLYLVKTFIEQHGGKVLYRETKGGGMTFIVELRKGKAHFKEELLSDSQVNMQNYVTGILAEEIPDHPLAEEGIHHLELMISNQQTIVVIDNNEEIRTYIRKVFKSNYAVLEARNGEDGLLLARRNLPDIIISEVSLDGITGIELCGIIKQDTSLSHIPVILLSGNYTPELRLQGIEAGAVDFIGKPFEKDLLIARVNGILKIKVELQNYFYNEITLKTDTRTISELHKDFLYRCIAIIEGSLLDADFDVNTISSEMGMGYSSLLKKIKGITGQSVNGFIRFVRLRKAAELMIHTNCNVNEAAFQVGINDIKYFRAQFYKQFGTNPSDFIRKHRKAFQKSYHLNNRQMI